MIQVDSDFYSNFQDAVASGDMRTLETIFLDEISNLIAKNRKEVLDLFGKVKIKKTTNPPNEEIVKKIVNEIRTNVKLRAGLSFLIAQENNLLVAKDSRDKDASEQTKEQVKQESINTVTFISESMGEFAKYLNQDIENFKKELISLVNNKAPNFSGKAYGITEKTTKKTTAKPKTKKWLYIVGGIAVVGLIYYGYKKGMFASKVVDAPVGV